MALPAPGRRVAGRSARAAARRLDGRHGDEVRGPGAERVVPRVPRRACRPSGARQAREHGVALARPEGRMTTAPDAAVSRRCRCPSCTARAALYLLESGRVEMGTRLIREM